MTGSPLICFYKDKFIRSENFEVVRQPVDQNLSDFLQKIKTEHPDQLKIVQVNFESGHSDFFKNQKSLYPQLDAKVYLIHEHTQLTKLPAPVASLELNPFKVLQTRSAFLEKIHYIQSEIAKGRLYQVNFTSAFVSDISNGQKKLNQTAENLFLNLAQKFTGHYPALLPDQDFSLLCFSPELFLRGQGNTLTAQPIKGSTHAQLVSTSDLLNSQKEEAELSMIVDLLRNDLNSVESKCSARVTRHRELLDLNYIQHTYSEIQLDSTKCLSQILPIVLPAGSISGCPKLESLKLISEIETYKRQAYTGVLGWWKNNEFELNVTIRNFVRTESDLIYNAGCGIVYDSNPLNEWHELLAKTGQLKVQYE